MDGIKILDDVLKYLYNNKGYKYTIKVTESIYGSKFKDEDLSLINAVLDKLVKDGYALEDKEEVKTQSIVKGYNYHTLYGYSISFEGIIFYIKGGYEKEFVLDLEKEKELALLASRSVKHDNQIFYLNVIVTIATVVAGVYSAFQLWLDYQEYLHPLPKEIILRTLV